MKTCTLFALFLAAVYAEHAVASSSIDPVGRDHGAAASGGLSFFITGAAEWTAFSNDEWIGLTSEAVGVGAGVLTYAVAANEGATRSGVIVVVADDQTHLFAVRQAAASAAVYFQHPDGRGAWWRLDRDGTFRSAHLLGNVAPWQLRTIGDYDGDGIDDLFWQTPGPNHQTAVWRLNADGGPRDSSLVGESGAWELRAIGDYDGDGIDDLFWQTRDGHAVVWMMAPDAELRETRYLGRHLRRRLVAVADIDGDGKADLLWQNAAGRIEVQHAADDAFRVLIDAGGLRLAAAADITGNGIADLLWQGTDRKVGAWIMSADGTVRETIRWWATGRWELRAASGLRPARRFSPDRVDEMALIPAGPFEMGDNFGQNSPFERPVHTVVLSAFLIDRLPVSLELWDTVKDWVSDNGIYYHFEGGDGKAPNHPVHSVMWYDAVKWCNARSEMEGLTPVYYMDVGLSNVYRAGRHDAPHINASADGYRLPTEAQWEKAARGGLSAQRFPWGNTIQHAQANYRSLSNFDYDLGDGGYHPQFDDGVLPYTSPVDWGEANGFGLLGVCGNVSDWVWDLFSDTYYETSPTHDPMGPEVGTTDPPMRVRRGGSFREVVFARTACRDYATPYSKFNSIGFRCVRLPEQ